MESDNDGIQQAGEPGLAGVTITLTGFNNSGQVVNMVTTTNSLGHYSFNLASPGTYVVTEGTTTGYIQGKRHRHIGRSRARQFDHQHRPDGRHQCDRL